MFILPKHPHHPHLFTKEKKTVTISIAPTTINNKNHALKLNTLYINLCILLSYFLHTNHLS